MGGISFNVLSLGSIADMLANGVDRTNGTGGIDIGSNLYDLAKRQSDKNAIQNYAKTSGNAEYEAVWNNYIYGDRVQENTSARIAEGKDELYIQSQMYSKSNTYTNQNIYSIDDVWRSDFYRVNEESEKVKKHKLELKRRKFYEKNH